MTELTLPVLKTAARDFLQELSATSITNLYGITDGKAVGTYVEQAFHRYLVAQYSYTPGSSALGIDFPTLEVDKGNIHPTAAVFMSLSGCQPESVRTWLSSSRVRLRKK